MDMYTTVASPSVSILRGSSFLTSAYRRPQSPVLQSSLSKPLISDTSCLNDEEVPTSTLPVKISTTTSISQFSVPELPPPQECSYTQALINCKKKRHSIEIYTFFLYRYGIVFDGNFSQLLIQQ